MNRIPKWLDELFIAHRGFFNENMPENSIAAFQLAIDRGYAIEFDVQILKDDTLVVFHDTHLKRMTGLNALIHDLNFDEIKELKLSNTEEYIPTFKEVLELVKGQVPLMVEFKNESSNMKLEALGYNLLKEYKGDFIIQSFNPLTVKWFKKNAAEIVRGQLSCRHKTSAMSSFKKFILRNVLLNLFSRPDYVIYDIKALDTFIIKWLKLLKKPLYGYTAKSIESYKDALSKGVKPCFEGFDPEEIE